MAFADDVAGLEHRFVETNGIRLHVAIGGPEDGPLVVMLHGFPECWLCWRHQFQPLCRAGFRIVAADMRGYNTSDKPPRVSDYRVGILVEDVVGLVRTLGRERAHVVGHDWGGVVAWHLAHRRGDVLDRLAIVNAPHPTMFLRRMRSFDQARRMYYAIFFQIPCVPERVLSHDDFRVFRNIFQYQPRRPHAFDDDDMRIYIDAFRQPGALTSALNYYRAMGRAVLRRFSRDERKAARLSSKIDRPTLVLWGLDDEVLPPECLDDLDQKVEKLEIVRIPNCSHWVTHDAPEIINRELLRFFARSP